MPGSPNTTPRLVTLSDGGEWQYIEIHGAWYWMRLHKKGQSPSAPLSDPYVIYHSMTPEDHRKIADVLDPPASSGVAEQAEPTQDALPPGESPQRTALCDAMVQMWTYAGRLAEAADEGITLDDTPGEPWMFDLRNPKAARALARLLTTRDAEGRDGELGEQTRAFWNRLRDSLAAPVPAAEPRTTEVCDDAVVSVAKLLRERFHELDDAVVMLPWAELGDDQLGWLDLVREVRALLAAERVSEDIAIQAEKLARRIVAGLGAKLLAKWSCGRKGEACTHPRSEHEEVVLATLYAALGINAERCSRCGKAIEGFAPPHDGVTAGYYLAEAWTKFANPGDVYICDACMWSDPRYVECYGEDVSCPHPHSAALSSLPDAPGEKP